MATRDGVEEYSTSPSAQRSSERSIRASWTTGYWGAAASIRASIATRFSTTAATIPRASSPAPGSASTSARSRSSTATAVRCPKSASNTAARATRRPARRDRMRSPDRLPSARAIRRNWPSAARGGLAARRGSPNGPPWPTDRPARGDHPRSIRRRTHPPKPETRDERPAWRACAVRVNHSWATAWRHAGNHS